MVHMNRPIHHVQYVCTRCDKLFIIKQHELGVDEDIDLCWDCIDEMFKDAK